MAHIIYEDDEWYREYDDTYEYDQGYKDGIAQGSLEILDAIEWGIIKLSPLGKSIDSSKKKPSVTFEQLNKFCAEVNQWATSTIDITTNGKWVTLIKGPYVYFCSESPETATLAKLRWA